MTQTERFATILADLQGERDGEFSNVERDRISRLDALVTFTRDTALQCGVDPTELDDAVAHVIVTRISARDS